VNARSALYRVARTATPFGDRQKFLAAANAARISGVNSEE
jgi:hypothetical protein